LKLIQKEGSDELCKAFFARARPNYFDIFIINIFIPPVKVKARLSGYGFKLLNDTDKGIGM
jgi:hypothetical protein